MAIDWRSLFFEQKAAGFPDVAGARASVTLPVSERLINKLIAEQVSPSAPVQRVEVHALAANAFTVQVKLARPAFLPPFTVRFAIEEQPRFPDVPLLVLRIVSSGGLMALAGTALRLFDVLPPGVTLERDRLAIDVRVLLQRHGQTEVLTYLENLEISTEPGRVVVSIRGVVPGGAGL